MDARLKARAPQTDHLKPLTWSAPRGFNSPALGLAAIVTDRFCRIGDSLRGLAANSVAAVQHLSQLTELFRFDPRNAACPFRTRHYRTAAGRPDLSSPHARLNQQGFTLMDYVHQRVALLGGVALSALGMAAPAQAVTNVLPGISHTDVTDDTLEICAIADDNCTFGVDANGTESISAIVSDTASGQVLQTGTAASADAFLNMHNDGSTKVGAHAGASGFSPVDATAIVERGVLQDMSVRGGNGAAKFDNDGLLDIGALATASATGIAHALAVVSTGLEQTALGSDAVASITNSGSIDMSAIANAKGAGALTAATSSGVAFTIARAATASAIVTGGLEQTAGGQQHGSASLTNTGSIALNATAHASGPGFEAVLASGTTVARGPHAFALVGGALVQQEFTPRGDGTLTLQNQGTIEIGVNAAATSTGLERADARAWAQGGIVQHAMGSTALASAMFDNSGAVTIDAIAEAKGIDGGGARASAQAGGGVYQNAESAGTASAQLENSGSLQFGLQAHAVANNNYAQAVGVVYGGIDQLVTGLTQNFGSGSAATFVGDAQASLVNEGTIRIGDIAVATGTAADAAADVALGINQYAVAAGNAGVSLDNQSLIDVGADASAKATNGTAFALGALSIGIGQRAIAGSSAAVDLSNDGSMEYNASAHAVAETAEGETAGNAVAVAKLGEFGLAGVLGAFDLEAIGSAASIVVTNSGSIALGAVATATGSAALVGANIIAGVVQKATGFDGSASVGIDNSGTLAMGAAAFANATGNDAHAVATIGAIAQTAFALNADASANLDNSGSIDLSAIASASGSGDAMATAIVNGIGQNAGAFATSTDSAAPSASASLDNSGKLDVTAIAKATAGTHVIASSSSSGHHLIIGPGGGGDGGGGHYVDSPTASAYANVFALSQAAPDASLVNSGTISVGVGASASAAYVANAHARGRMVGQQAMNFAGGDAFASLSNGEKASLMVLASAKANDGDATASAQVSSGLLQLALASEAAYASMANSGTISIGASANASGVGGLAHAVAGNGFGNAIVQVATGATATADLTNSGEINFAAIANAEGKTAAATAKLDGIFQQAAGYSVAENFANSGTIALGASAAAQGMFAHALAVAEGALSQTGAGWNAAQDASNSGSISITGIAHVDALTAAFLTDAAQMGMEQIFSADAVSQTASNSGTIDIAAIAEATADQGRANVLGFARDGMYQLGQGSAVDQMMSNTGKVSIEAKIKAVAASGAFVDALAGDGLEQFAAASSAHQTLNNSGTVLALADATAIANGIASGDVVAGTAFVNAKASGLVQTSYARSGLQSLTNSGTVSVGAHALASAPAVATAHGAQSAGNAVAAAVATGASQYNHASVSNTFANSGKINVGASATAVGAAGGARATAYGYVGFHIARTEHATVQNSGVMNVSAVATAPGTASAVADGISLENAAPFFGPANPMSGSVTNDGTVNVLAKAFGATVTGYYTVPTADGSYTWVSGQHAGSVASASGIAIRGGVNNMTVTNTGTLDVEAVTASGGAANAYGVRITANGDVTPTVHDKFTFTNDGGTIIVRQSTDGGATWKHGMAIDLTEAPNASTVNLVGDGVIYGNIAVQAGDRIDVKGTTYFDGIIGPSFKPAGGVTSALLDSGVTGQGTLNIMDGSNLILADARGAANAAMYDGPSYVAVDTFNVASDGTLTLNFAPASAGVQAVGIYSQVYADTAKLDGTLVVNVTPQGGRFADSYSWQNVIDANTLSGKFAHCGLGGGYADSVLLKLSCSYDSNANVDLSLNRVAFNAVAGLTANEASVGGGIESAYQGSGAGAQSAAAVQGAGATGSGPFGALVGNLFRLNSAEYSLALNEMTGAGYAGYLQSFNSLGYHYNSVLDRASECDQTVLGGSALECRTSPFHLWAQLDYDHLNQNGDDELAGGSGHRSTLIAGADVNLSPAAVVGISAGSVSNHDPFADAAGSDIKGDGWQLGAYGVYDPGAFFVKALGTYSALNGTAHRHFDFGGSPGMITGNPDATMWTLGLHGGYRLQFSPANLVTPFVNYDYTGAKLRGFTEDGTTGAELTVNGGSEKHSWLTGGVKWTGRFGGIVPEASVAWRHVFGDARASFNANFAASPATADFDIVSMSQKSDALLAGVSIGGKLGPLDVRVAYQGAFGGGTTEHAGLLKLVLPLNAPSARHAPVAPPQQH